MQLLLHVAPICLFQVMQHFFSDRYDKKQLPRVLGLSASLLNKNRRNVETLRVALNKLEETMARSKITTARDLKEVEQFAARPEQVLEVYSAGPGKLAYAEAHAVIDSLVAFLNGALQSQRHDSSAEKSKLEEKTQVLHRHVSTCGVVLSDLGPWAAMTVRSCQQ